MSEVVQLNDFLSRGEHIVSELCEEGFQLGGFETIDKEEEDHTRWGVVYRMVTKAPSGKLYSWSYEEGATEMQDYVQYYPGNVHEVKEVTRQVTVTEYVEV